MRRSRFARPSFRRPSGGTMANNVSGCCDCMYCLHVASGRRLTRWNRSTDSEIGRSRRGIEDAGLRNQLVLDGVHGKSENLQGREPYEVPVAQDHGDSEALALNLEEGEADRELDRASDDREPGASIGRDAQAVRDRSVHHGVGRAGVYEDPLELQGAPWAVHPYPCVDLAHVRGHRVCRYEQTCYMHVAVGRADAQSRPTPGWQGRRRRMPRSLQSPLEGRRQHVCMAGNPYTGSEVRPMTESPASQTV